MDGIASGVYADYMTQTLCKYCLRLMKWDGSGSQTIEYEYSPERLGVLILISQDCFFEFLSCCLIAVLWCVYIVSVCLLSITYATDEDGCIAVETFG